MVSLRHVLSHGFGKLAYNMNIKNRTLFIADNLDILRGINSDCIDLIYLDPPFNSKKQYKAPIGSPAEGASFKDIWTDEDIKYEWHGQIAEEHQELYQIIQVSEAIYDKSMKIYLMAMAIRLFEMKRILKPTGNFYLHCDPTASHYLKMVMDSLFGKQNFRNEIIWHYHMGTSPKKDFRKKHDIIFRYSKSDSYRGVGITVPRRMDPKRFNKVDEEGRRYHVNGAGKRFYADEGRTPDDVWTYCDDKKFTQLNSMAKERTGWPTQKPLALLEHIIKASSNEGNVVLDPFCGCATACVAAEQLQRQWVGIDISPSAEVITKIRLTKEVDKSVGLFNPLADVSIVSKPPVRTDIEKLPKAHTHKHQLYGEQEGKCAGCHIFLPFRNMTIDHIVPQSKGGTDAKENLQLLCNACNATKSTRSQSEFFEILREQGIRTDTVG